MHLISAIFAICSTAAVSTLACPSSTIAKRWFGVGNPAEGEPATINAWPVVKDSESAYDLEYDTLQLLRYCWTDKDSYNTLNDLLEAAIGKWHIATSQSNLRIVPAAGGVPPICAQGSVAIDSLYITDITSSDEAENSAGYTSPGYNAIERDRKIAGRHVLKFRRSGDDNTDAVILAHEIGHAIGLDHEFARPDAAEHVFFYPENLIDYDEVKAKIDASNSGDTIEMACKSRAIALKYGFSAYAYLPPSDQFGSIGQWAWSKQYDHDSIMNYNSFDGGRDGLPVLMAHAPGTTDRINGKRWTTEMGFCGEISSGDIARVQQLYPTQEGMDENDQGKQPEWQGTSIPINRRQATATATTATKAAACTPKYTTVGGRSFYKHTN